MAQDQHGHGHGHDHGHGHGHGRGQFVGHTPDQYERRTKLLGRLIYPRVVKDVARAGLPADARVLDVGTGPGTVPTLLAARLPRARIDAVDVDPGMAARAAENLARFGDRVTATASDVADLPFPDDAFDLVVSCLSLHHWEDPAAGIREILRVLRPGGRVWIYDLGKHLAHAVEAGDAAGARSEVRPRLRPLPFDPIGRVQLTAR